MSVPDAEILVEIADVLDTDISVLLGKEVSERRAGTRLRFSLQKSASS